MLPLRAHIGYGIGDFGQNIVFQAVTIYLLSFYTDVFGLSPAFAGGLFLAARIWDGLNDPLMGYLAQRTRSRWGRYRPYLLLASIPVALSMFLLFAAPDLSMTGRRWYAVGTYLLFGMSFTALNVPYGTLTALMTTDYRERARLTGWRMSFAMLGGIAAGFGFLPVVEAYGGGLGGYRKAALLAGGLILLTLWVSFASVRERVSPRAQRPLPLAEGWRVLRQNRPFWLLAVAFASCFAAWAAFAATAPYYFRYVIGRPELTSYGLLAVMGTTALTIPLWTLLSQRIGKHSAFLLGTGGYLLAFAGLWFIPQPSLPLLISLLIIQGIGNGSAVLASWSMIPDTVEYGIWRSGQPAEGLLYGVYGFFIKLGLGLGAALAGWGLGLSGYAPDLPPTPGLLQGIRFLLALVPALFVLLALLTMLFYPITPHRYQEIRSALDQASTSPA
ncbi:MAG: MFS transporter [Bacteroidetes bacterium]|nr:MAG: MFS transporter [Bacteroidota bacterium]